MQLTNQVGFKKRVVVAMSGGVDSSTVAAMMVEAGHEVIGVTMQLYDQKIDLAKKGACCAGQDIYDAKQVADNLNIPHYVLDYESRFHAKVMLDFADSYMQGETPIPCVRCNQTVKFADLFAFAKNLAADCLITGHYVRKLNTVHGPELHKGIDNGKDQSYFLFSTTKEQLEFLEFPLGVYTKHQTRDLASKYNLQVADKPDSQDICFVPNGNYREIITKLRPGAIDPGEIIDLNGKVLGYHKGIINFTIGQRRGIGISSSNPLYVIKLIPEKRQVVIGPEAALYQKEFTIKEVNWLSEPVIRQEYNVKIRSATAPIMAQITQLDAKKAIISLKQGEKAITPGQACVIYQETKVIGGGFINDKII